MRTKIIEISTVLCMLSLSLLSCSKDEAKEEKMLDVFNDAQSELGKAEEPSPDTQDSSETNSKNRELSNSQENVLGLENIPKKNTESLPETAHASNSFDLSLPYSLISKLAFMPIDTHSISETELLLVGPYNISILNLKSLKETPLLTKEIYLSLYKKEMPLITSYKHQGGTDIVLGFVNGEVMQHVGNDWKVLQGGPAYSNDRVNSIIDHEGKILIGSKGIYIWEPDLNRFMSSQESKKLSINSMLAIGPNLVIFVTADSLVSLSFPEKAINSFFTPLPSEKPILSLQQDGDNLLVGTIRGILRITKSGEILSRFASSYSVSKIIKGLDNDLLVLTDKGPGVLTNDEVFVDSSLANGKVSSLSLNLSNEIILGLNSGELVKAPFSEFSKTFKRSEKKEKFKEVFPNACRAHEKLLGSSPYSHQISYLEIDSEPYVFMDGKQVCPNGVGHMDKFGSAIVFKDNVLKLSSLNTTATIKPTEEVLTSKLTHVLFSKSRKIYVGTEKGLFISGDKEWSRVEEPKELSEDFISDILEDHRGNIWVSTRISSTDAESEITGYHPLHVQINESWAQFGSKNGISAFGISDLSSSDQDIIMGSTRGFSILTPKSELNIYGRASGLIRSIVESVSRDKRGRIWISSGFFLNGISWIDNDKIYTLEESGGLFANRIYRIGVDEEDRVWIVDSSGKTGVYDYGSLVEMAEVSDFHDNRAEREKFLP